GSGRVVDGGPGHDLDSGDRGGHAVADAGGDGEVAVEVQGRIEGHAREQGVDIGDGAAGAPHAGAGVVGGGDRARGRGGQAAGGHRSEERRGGKVGGVRVARGEVE